MDQSVHKIPNITDPYIWSGKRKILTEAQLHLPGLEMIGHCLYDGTSVPMTPHTHNDSIELVYLVSGLQPYTIGDKVYRLSGNQIFVTPAGAIHSSGEAAHGKYELFWLRIYHQFHESFLGLARPYSDLLHHAVLSLSQAVISPKKSLRPLFCEIFECFADDRPLQRLKGISLIQELAATICLSEHTQKTHVSSQLSPAQDYICTHLYENITLEELSEVTNLSLSRFKQRFQKEVGITPREYINLKKIEQAKIMLKNGLPVTETAFRLNFSSSSYFSTVFRQNVGMSPSQYQKTHLADEQ